MGSIRRALGLEKRFDGQSFKWAGEFRAKRLLRQEAKRLQGQGYYIRITRGKPLLGVKGPYTLWKRKKS